MPFGAGTHAGRKYTHNEDCIGWDEARGVYVIADGMGGHAGGEVASRIVRDTVLEHVRTEALDRALLAAHHAVVGAAATAEKLGGMGSTAIVARVDGRSCEIAWVGDSRAYLLRRGALSLLTRDHSYVEALIERGAIDVGEARNHPDRNIVLQTLGVADPDPSLATLQLREGDRLLLCSDGLNDELDDAEIAAVLSLHADPHAAAAQLIDAALAKGGRDNVSVIVLDPPLSRRLGDSFRIARPAAAIWLPVLIGWTAAMLLFVLWYGIIKS
jgi:PPM family protein phosphatase